MLVFNTLDTVFFPLILFSQARSAPHLPRDESVVSKDQATSSWYTHVATWYCRLDQCFRAVPTLVTCPPFGSQILALSATKSAAVSKMHTYTHASPGDHTARHTAGLSCFNRACRDGTCGGVECRRSWHVRAAGKLPHSHVDRYRIERSGIMS